MICSKIAHATVCRESGKRSEMINQVVRPAIEAGRPAHDHWQTEMNTSPVLFHLAFPVRDLAEARAFYGELLRCPEGRSSADWIDFDFQGHQIVAHLAPEECRQGSTNAVDGEQVPVRHFGAILPLADWERLAARLKAAGTRFIIEPQIRFKGLVGEQATMFFLDPSGNALEFKSFADPSQLFAKQAAH